MEEKWENNGRGTHQTIDLQIITDSAYNLDLFHQILLFF
jgi:hypothetical protein